MRHIALLLFAAAALGWSAAVQAVRIGAFPSQREEIHFDLPLDVDSNGQPRSTQEVGEVRSHLVVPDFYGRLFAVTQDGARSILWYIAEDATVRNVVVDASSTTAYSIDQRTAAHAISHVVR